MAEAGRGTGEHGREKKWISQSTAGRKKKHRLLIPILIRRFFSSSPVWKLCPSQARGTRRLGRGKRHIEESGNILGISLPVFSPLNFRVLSIVAIYTFSFVSCSLTIIVTSTCSHSSQSIHSYIKAICVIIHSRITLGPWRMAWDCGWW